MFLPAFCDLSPCVERRYIWHFYGAVNMQKRCNGAVIAPEDYFQRPSQFITEETVKAWDKHCFANQNLPKDEDLEKITQCRIPQALQSKIIKKYGSKSDAAVALYKERIPELEAWFQNTLKELGKHSQEKVEALVLLVDIPSFSLPCREQEIPVLYYEFGAFREPTYYNVGYYSETGVHLHLELESLYQEFKTQASELKSWELFTPKELLALFLVPEKLCLLGRYGTPSRYAAGVLAEITFFPAVQAVSHKNTLDVLDVAINRFGRSEVLVRNHPGDPLRPSFENLGVDLDTSPSAAEFILQCSRIVSRTSNSIFEALLWGRSVYSLDELPYRFACLSTLDGEAEQEIDLLFLNFMAFAFYFPMEFVYDLDYMRWRCKKPSWVEIYRKNLEYLLAVRGVTAEAIATADGERCNRILAARGADASGQIVLNRQAGENIPQLIKEISMLKQNLDIPDQADILQLQRRKEQLRYAKLASGMVSQLQKLPTPIMKTSKSPKTFWTESTLFYDSGKGFNEQEKVVAHLECSDGEYHVEFELPEETQERMKAFRWDPLEGVPVAIAPQALDGIELSPINSCRHEAGIDYFCTADPMYQLSVTGDCQAIKLKGRMRLLEPAEAEQFVEHISEMSKILAQEVESLQKENAELRMKFRNKCWSFIRKKITR